MPTRIAKLGLQHLLLALVLCLCFGDIVPGLDKLGLGRIDVQLIGLGIQNGEHLPFFHAISDVYLHGLHLPADLETESG